MSTQPRPFPPALPHGELREVLSGIYIVTGTVAMPGPLPVRFSRNMTIVREGARLVLVNSVRSMIVESQRSIRSVRLPM